MENVAPDTTTIQKFKIPMIIAGVLMVLGFVGWFVSMLFFSEKPPAPKPYQLNVSGQPVHKNPNLQPPTPEQSKVTASTIYPAVQTPPEQSQPPQQSPVAVVPGAPSTAGKPQSSAAPPPINSQLSASGKRKGIAFLNAVIKPLDYELHSRLWGWRVNDKIQPTDNVNNFQIGALEVIRRTAEQLLERISRPNTSVSPDENLQNVVNCLMVNADKFMLPSAESKYEEAIDNLRNFLKKIERGEATIYTRKENLIPLLTDYEALLGSCQLNLIKKREDGKDDVSFFKADDYFYYAKGVATAIGTIAESLPEDFHESLTTSVSKEILNNLIADCKRASRIEPWVILNNGYDSVFANHRANMASPVGHCRVLMGHLIKVITATAQ